MMKEKPKTHTHKKPKTKQKNQEKKNEKKKKTAFSDPLTIMSQNKIIHTLIDGTANRGLYSDTGWLFYYHGYSGYS